MNYGPLSEANQKSKRTNIQNDKGTTQICQLIITTIIITVMGFSRVKDLSKTGSYSETKHSTLSV